MPAVQANDVFFAIHAVALTAVVLFQIAIYPKGGQKLSRLVMVIIGASVCGGRRAAAEALACGARLWPWPRLNRLARDACHRSLPASRPRISPAAALTASAFIVAILVAVKVSSWFTWLNYLLYLSYIKLAITLMKYTPQAYLNWKRKSTKGWT